MNRPQRKSLLGTMCIIALSLVCWLGGQSDSSRWSNLDFDLTDSSDTLTYINEQLKDQIKKLDLRVDSLRVKEREKQQQVNTLKQKQNEKNHIILNWSNDELFEFFSNTSTFSASQGRDSIFLFQYGTKPKSGP